MKWQPRDFVLFAAAFRISSLTCAMLSVSVRAWFVVVNLFRAVLIAVIFGRATSSMFLMLRIIPAYSHMIFWICFL